MARLALILARARNGVIGNAGKLPWHLPADLAFFKATTLDHAIIMGRKTWDSIGRPLPRRRSIVVTRNPAWSAPGAERANSLDAALALCGPDEQVFVIGGAELYAAALPRADRLILTEIDHDFDGDTHLPAPDPHRWRETSRHPGHADGFDYAFLTYDRR